LSGGPNAVSRQTVFVVDDDPSVRKGLKRLLKSAGWNVETFSSAEEFLERSREVGSGCVIIDVHLGSMSGLELQAILEQRPNPIPVILTSGVADVDMDIESLRRRALAFYRKPFDVDALLDSVRRGLELATPR
jgi:two-component system, LuxR family, response regulator FixJ